MLNSGHTLTPHLHQVAEKRDGLNGFAQTHLVCQDAVDPIFPEWGHPEVALDLVIPHHTARKQQGLVIVDILTSKATISQVLSLTTFLFCDLFTIKEYLIRTYLRVFLVNIWHGFYF